MSDVPFEEEGTDYGNPSGFIAWTLDVGLSGRQGLAEYRSLGGKIADAQWSRLSGQIADTLARTEGFLSADYNAVLGPADLGEWAAGQGGRFAYQVVIQQVDTETGLLSAAQYTVMSDDPLSKQQAEQQAMADFANPENEQAYAMNVVGAFTIHGWATVPYTV